MKTAHEDKIGEAAPLPVQLIPLEQILPDPKNRKDHDKAKLQLLADEIAVVGLLQPILVRAIAGEKTKYMIVAGERRWLAHKLLKRDSIEARVTRDDSLVLSIRKRGAENFHREDLSPIEKADFLQELFDAKMNQTEIAAFVGVKDQSTISNFMRLRRLPADVKAMIHDGRLSRAHGVVLVRFDRWPKVVSFIAAQAIKEETSAKNLERATLPFSYQLKQKALVFEIETSNYSWVDRPAYVIPAELQKDPDFLKSGSDWYCFAPQKWAPEKARQDAEWKKKQSAKAKSSSSSSGGGMSEKEKKERSAKISKNKAARAAIADTLARGIARLKSVSDIDTAALMVVVDRALSHAGEIDDAAEVLGVKLPLKMGAGYSDLDELRKLGPATAVKIAAVAIMQGDSEAALRFASATPDSSDFIAGKFKGKPAIDKSGSVDVSVKTGNDNIARAGSATGSSTSSAAQAAKVAAAKYFGCKEAEIKLATKSSSSGKNTYTASRKGKAAK